MKHRLPTALEQSQCLEPLFSCGTAQVLSHDVFTDNAVRVFARAHQQRGNALHGQINLVSASISSFLSPIGIIGLVLLECAIQLGFFHLSCQIWKSLTVFHQLLFSPWEWGEPVPESSRSRFCWDTWFTWRARKVGFSWWSGYRVICFTRLCDTHLSEVMNGRMRVSSFQKVRRWFECYICFWCLDLCVKWRDKIS